MAITYGKTNRKQTNIIYTVVTAVLLFAVFLNTVSYFYENAEKEAYNILHLQTKQIKDDLSLQIKSDRENLLTMANFAAKLYAEGEDYDKMFDSFKPIGLFSNIGILNPDNTFVTKMGTVDLNGKISFFDEAKKGSYISGRVPDLTREGSEIIRSAVPIVSSGQTVGVLYGLIPLETLGEKYNNMAKEIDAQLFVYDKESGKFVIDTTSKNPGKLSELRHREYNDGYSYQDLIHSDNGYSSFKSIFTGEDLYVHFSTISDFNWGIMLARYESQVFAETNKISQLLLVSFALILLIMILYTAILVKNEKRLNSTTKSSSSIRRLLLEINQNQNSIIESLKLVCTYTKSRSAIIFDTDGEDYNYFMPVYEDTILSGDDRKYFISRMFYYASEHSRLRNTTLSVLAIKPSERLLKSDREFYDFMKTHQITKILFAAVVNKENHITILGVINPVNDNQARMLIEDIAVCFSIALFNKKHLDKTEIAATTDSLTGVSNRVTYKKDLLFFDDKKPENFSCLYIDVNELHIRNNKYGHAAGDEMLIYIANTLKEIFYGHKVYRMGGDEFLVFVSNAEQETISKAIDLLLKQLALKDYHVAVGFSFRKQNPDTEEMVREAEKRMYEAKAKYYQKKEQVSTAKAQENTFVQIKTGILEIDMILSVLKEHYNGIYRVFLDTDKATRILMPAYLGYNENEEHFSKLISKYVEDSVSPDFQRAVTSFLNYDVLKSQLQDGNTPKIAYRKNNGESVILTVYKLGDEEEKANNTLWIFSKE